MPLTTRATTIYKINMYLQLNGHIPKSFSSPSRCMSGSLYWSLATALLQHCKSTQLAVVAARAPSYHTTESDNRRRDTSPTIHSGKQRSYGAAVVRRPIVPMMAVDYLCGGCWLVAPLKSALNPYPFVCLVTCYVLVTVIKISAYCRTINTRIHLFG